MLNLITDAWIPVRLADGGSSIIAPWQMTDSNIVAPNWSRPDMNLACYELLIGIVFMALPPATQEEWLKETRPSTQDLKAALMPFAPAFNLIGDGPLFLQDLEPLTGDPNSVDMLFIDSAGGNTAKNNADLMVHRDRYGRLDLATAAMALYTFQAFAPSGGAGNRTSMRGGGPLLTLIGPFEDLWGVIWANLPEGKPSKIDDLPWMRATRVSDNKQTTHPPEGKLFNLEAFFGMPRRLRLVSDGDQVVGVIQKPWGTNYAGWVHPLSPYYRMKAGEELLPKHPRAGRFGFRNWLGVTVDETANGLTELAHVLKRWTNIKSQADVIVGGWSMDNMKPRDFIYAVAPLPELSEDAMSWLIGLIKSADQAAIALRGALAAILAEGEMREAEREAFYLALEPLLLESLQRLEHDDPRKAWLKTLRDQALSQFDALALVGLDQKDSRQIGAVVEARKFLSLNFSGYGKQGQALFKELGFEPPIAKKRKAA